jgi:hypothetical protein
MRPSAASKENQGLGVFFALAQSMLKLVYSRRCFLLMTAAMRGARQGVSGSISRRVDHI